MRKFIKAEFNIRTNEEETPIELVKGYSNEIYLFDTLISLGFHKNYSCWKVTHLPTGMNIINYCSTKEEGLIETKRIINQQGKKNYFDVIKRYPIIQKPKDTMEYKAKKLDYFRLLEEKFGFKIPKDTLFMALGILTPDVVKLNELLKVPEGKSMTDYVIEKYGEEANEMLNFIIS